jgi:hypothetical protein
MTPDHTPGPWAVATGRTPDLAGHGPAIRIKGPLGIRLAYIIDGAPEDTDGITPTMEADARLIAAAPDLLTALEAWTEWAVNRDVPFALISKTRAAIAKATKEADA